MNLSAGNSAWKSRLIRGVTSDIANSRATISLPCHLPRHNSPLCDSAIFTLKLSEDTSTPVYLNSKHLFSSVIDENGIKRKEFNIRNHGRFITFTMAIYNGCSTTNKTVSIEEELKNQTDIADNI